MSEKDDRISFISQIIQSKRAQHEMESKTHPSLGNKYLPSQMVQIPEKEIQKTKKLLLGKGVEELASIYVDEQSEIIRLYEENLNVLNKWELIIPQSYAKELTKEYDFSESYDLQGKLGAVIWTYHWRKKAQSSPDKAIRNFYEQLEKMGADSLDYESEQLCVAVSLWESANKRKARYKTWRGKVALTKRWFQEGGRQRNIECIKARYDGKREDKQESKCAKRRSGRAIDWDTKSFFRSLGVIYKDGTGRKPYFTPTTYRQKNESTGESEIYKRGWRGKPYKFVKMICSKFGIKINQGRLNELLYRKNLKR